MNSRVSISIFATHWKRVNVLPIRAHEKGLKLSYDIPPELPDTLVGDPSG